MAIDPSIALNANRPQAQPYNALTQLGQVAQTGNALIGLQQNSAQIAARSALADAYSRAPIDPQTGMPDQKSVLSSLAADPRGAWMMPQVIQGLQQQQKLQYELNAAGLKQTTDRTSAVNGALAPLMRMGANVSPQDVYSTIAGLHAAGMPTDEFVQDAATTLPVKQPGMSDAQYGQQLQGWIVNHAARSWPAGVQADKFAPNIATVDTGGNIVTRDVNPYTNPGISSAAPIGRTFSPGEQASQVKGPLGPNGQPTVQTQAGYAAANGLGNLVPGSGPGAASPFANGGRFPSALLNRSGGGAAGYAPPAAGSIGAGSPGYAPASVAAPAPQPVSAPGMQAPPQPGTPAFSNHADERFAPPTAAAPGPATPVPAPAAPGYGPPAAGQAAATPYGAPMVVALGPGQAAGATAAGDASAKQWAALQSSVGSSAGRIYQLHSALTDLQALGQTGTGPSAATLNNVRSYLQSLPGIGSVVGIDPNQIANYDMANKALTAYAAARAGAHGGTTDSQLATTLSSNASTHISNLAATNVVKANIGLERMDQAQMAGFQQGLDPVTGQPTGQQLGPEQFADYSSRWNSSHDARAFVADQLTPQAFNTMLSGMSPADQARFQATFNSGIAQGFISPPAWMQQPGSGAATTATTAAAPAPAGAPQGAPPAPPAAVAPQAAPVPTQSAGVPYSLAGTGLPAVMGGM